MSARIDPILEDIDNGLELLFVVFLLVFVWPFVKLYKITRRASRPAADTGGTSK